MRAANLRHLIIRLPRRHRSREGHRCGLRVSRPCVMSHTEEPLKKKDAYLQCRALVSLFLFVFVSVLLIAGEPGVKQAKKRRLASTRSSVRSTENGANALTPRPLGQS